MRQTCTPARPHQHPHTKTDRISHVYAFVDKSGLQIPEIIHASALPPLPSRYPNLCPGPRHVAGPGGRDGAVSKERLGDWEQLAGAPSSCLGTDACLSTVVLAKACHMAKRSVRVYTIVNHTLFC
jgi:hypothetical protein